MPVRSGPAFAAAENVTVPGPVPDAPALTVSQSALFDVAVHAHVLPVETLTDPVPPAAGIVCAVGAMVNAHGASSDTVNV